MKYLSAIIFLACLVGCAGNRQPERSALKVTLAYPLALEQITDSRDTTFAEVRAAEVLAPIGATYPAGSLWFELQLQNSGSWQWVPVNEIESWDRVSRQTSNLKSEPARVQLRNGQVIHTRTLHPKWCPSAIAQVNSVDPKMCLEVLSLLGNTVDRRAFSALSSENISLPVYWSGGANRQSPTLQAVKRVFSGSEVSAEKAKLLEANKQYVAMQRQQQEIASARARDEEKRRLMRIQSAKSGTTDNCTSVDLVPRNQPVSSKLFIRCGSLGIASIQELKDSGWDVQILQRIPTQGMITTADSVELAIRKK